MIKRIVKLEFHEEFCDKFAEFSNQIKSEIENFEGCSDLDILRDIKNPNIFFTCSVWDSQEALDSYRKSDFFTEIWPQAKKWFSGRPNAWSAEII